MQFLAAQVEKAVLQTNFFRVFKIAKNRQGKFLRGSENFHLADENFDLAGRQFRIDGFVRALLHVAVDANAPLGSHCLRETERIRIRINHALSDAVMIAQIDEQHPAMIPDPVYPTGKSDGLAFVGQTKITARVATVGVHSISSAFFLA